MTATPEQAEDETFALFKAAWDDGASAIVGYTPEVRYEGKEKTSVPAVSKYWVRISMQFVAEDQATLSDCVAVAGSKRFETSGLVFVQVFAPKTDSAEGYRKGRLLAKLARNAFRGKHTSPGNVWFRRCRINNVLPDADFYKFNVVSDFQFQEIG